MARQTFTVTDSKTNKLTNVADPTAAQDAATKFYVDGRSYFPPESDAQKNTNFGLNAQPTPGTAFESTAIGEGALRQATSGQGTAVGYLALGAVPAATESTAVGGQAGLLATGTALTLIGHGSGYYPIDIGASNQATMVGAYATSYTAGGGTQATSLGFQARSAIAGTALGATAQARGLYSTAVGHGAIATLDNQIMLGTSAQRVYVNNDPVANLEVVPKQYVDVNFSPINHTHASTTEFRWTYDNVATMSDPGTGKIRTNTAAGTPSTQATVSEITALGVDASSVLKSLTVGDLIYFQQLNNADNWGRYTIDGTPVNNGTWWLLPIKAVEQHGAAIAKNQDVIVRFTYGGGGGAGGIGGIEIFAQPVAPGPSTTDLFWLDVDDTSVQGSQFWRAWKGTQAAYDAISTKDPDTLYVVT